MKRIMVLSSLLILSSSLFGQNKNDAENRASASIKEIVGHYLDLKNALTTDNSKEAAAASKEIFESLGKLDQSSLTSAQKKVYDDVADDAKENAEHIGEAAGKIDHQREHFELLSKDMIELVKAFGAGQLLYQDFCPMYGEKGAMWLSEVKEIKNPYFGKKMPKCGSLKEEIK